MLRSRREFGDVQFLAQGRQLLVTGGDTTFAEMLHHDSFLHIALFFWYFPRICVCLVASSVESSRVSPLEYAQAPKEDNLRYVRGLHSIYRYIMRKTGVIFQCGPSPLVSRSVRCLGLTCRGP